MNEVRGSGDFGNTNLNGAMNYTDENYITMVKNLEIQKKTIKGAHQLNKDFEKYFKTLKDSIVSTKLKQSKPRYVSNT